MAVTTINFQFPYFSGYPTEALLPQPVFPAIPPTLTTPAGVQTLSAQGYSTPEFAAWVANMLGGTVTSYVEGDGTLVQYNQPTYLVLLNNGLLNPALVAQCFLHGSYPLTSPDTGTPGTTGANIADMIMSICAGVGYSVNLVLTIAPPPAPPVTAPVMVGKPFGDGLRYAFGTGVIPAVTQGALSQLSTVAAPQPSNVYNGMAYDDPVEGPLIAFVYSLGIFKNVYSGWWWKTA